MPPSPPTESSTFRWSIKWKLMAMITILVVVLVAILSYTQISSQRRILEAELENRISLMKANLIERGKSFITNLEMNLVDVPEDLAGKDFYGKVIETAGGNDRRCVVRFTSAPPEVASYFLAHRQLAGN